MTAEEFGKKWGLTQAAIAKLIDSSPSTIAHWSSVGEHDASRKQPPTVGRLLSVLDSLFTMLEGNPAIVEVWLSRKVRKSKRTEKKGRSN